MSTPREEAEAVVRCVRRTCRGPAVLPVELRRELFAEYRTAFDAPGEAWTRLIQLKQRLERETKLKVVGLVVGDVPGITQQIMMMVDLRRGCGADFNSLIIENKFDGKEHTVVCSACGEEHTYVAPWFETLTEHLD